MPEADGLLSRNSGNGKEAGLSKGRELSRRRVPE